MPRTTRIVSRAGFVADWHSIDRDNGGRQIDWAAVTAAYLDAATGKKSIPAGTVMAELANGRLVPRAISGAVTATCILATNAQEGALHEALTGYGVILGGILHENMLPDSTGTPKVLPAAWKTELQAAGVGTGFGFRQYENNQFA